MVYDPRILLPSCLPRASDAPNSNPYASLNWPTVSPVVRRWGTRKLRRSNRRNSAWMTHDLRVLSDEQGQRIALIPSAAGYTSVPPGNDRTPGVSLAGSTLFCPMMCATGTPSANR
jgi:hypothetical protein